MVRIAPAIASLLACLALAASAGAAEDPKAGDSGVNHVDPTALDGLCYALTVTPGKGTLPPAAANAGIKGWMLTFGGGKAIVTIPNGGDAKCKFSATVANGAAEVQNAAGGSLPHAQGLAPKAGFVSVTLEVAGEITDKGKSFTGRITWTEKDDRKDGKHVFNVTGSVPQSN